MEDAAIKKSVMDLKFTCPSCGTSYLTHHNNFGRYAKCRKCEYLFEVSELTNITSSFKNTFIDKILIQGADSLYNEVDKIIMKMASVEDVNIIQKDNLLNYNPFELLYFTNYIVCELLKLEHLSKKTYREIVFNFLRMHLKTFKITMELRVGKALLFLKEGNDDETRQRARMGEYLSYLSNIGSSWESVILYDRDRSIIFQAIVKVVERLSHHLFKGEIKQLFVDETVEAVQLFFANQIDLQQKFQKLVLEEVIKIKKIS